MSKQLAFRDEARRELKEGIDKLTRAVTTTLSSKGRNGALVTIIPELEPPTPKPRSPITYS